MYDLLYTCGGNPSRYYKRILFPFPKIVKKHGLGQPPIPAVLYYTTVPNYNQGVAMQKRGFMCSFKKP